MINNRYVSAPAVQSHSKSLLCLRGSKVGNVTRHALNEGKGISITNKNMNKTEEIIKVAMLSTIFTN